MSQLKGTYSTKKQALGVAESLIRNGFKGVGVFRKEQNSVPESAMWNHPTWGRKVIRWHVRMFCTVEELKNSILKD